MRIAIITESFPPDVNGVAHCVVRVAENLLRKGHQPLVIAPDPGRGPDNSWTEVLTDGAKWRFAMATACCPSNIPKRPTRAIIGGAGERTWTRP